jgi:hypothetical protein
MAAKVSRGSIILEILIVVFVLLLVAVIIVPNQIWDDEQRVTTDCRNNLNSLYEAERFYYRANSQYTDTVSKVLSFVQADSGLQQRQSLVSLTRSFRQVLNNVLEIPALEEISAISQSSYEITGDLLGNDRYFRKYEELLDSSLAINRDMGQFDSSMTFPNFAKVKSFVDSLRDLDDNISDISLQNSIQRGIDYVDSIDTYFNYLEIEEVTSFWDREYKKITGFIASVNQTDITKVSSVCDRLKKFIDKVDQAINALQTVNLDQDQQRIEAERQNLQELHQKFLSPQFFILTQRYGLTSLSELDSILINLNQNEFTCPDDHKMYLIDTLKGGHFVVECPNLLDYFHGRFLEAIDPVRELPYMKYIRDLDSVIIKTQKTLDDDRTVIRRYTDILLSLKEQQAELNAMTGILFYRYSQEFQDFIKLLDKTKKLSVLKPAIEDILNPMDTLATRISNGNIADLTEGVQNIHNQLRSLDSMVSEGRLPRSVKRRYETAADTFALALDIVPQIKSAFSESYAEAMRQAENNLEQALVHALEGREQRMYLIFSKTHINHGYILDGEKSWEEEQ